VRLTRGIRRAPLLALVMMVAACGVVPVASPDGSAPSSDGAVPSAAITFEPTVPGHELYGFMPYWEMDNAGIADHLAGTPLTTLGLFSVTHTGKGAINTTSRGYQAITGDSGKALVRAARTAGARVELVYTSFGAARNRKLFGSTTLQAKVVASLVTLVGELGLDGVDVDVEGLDATLVPAYGGFVGDLRAAIVAADPSDTVSVATGAHGLGAAMAAAAASAEVDRIFLMGYDYRTGRSDPGATSPLDRTDGGEATLRTSLDLYAALGVPADRLLLGLPLYGVSWPVAGPVVGAPSTGKGDAWFPRDHVDLLTKDAAAAVFDPIEQVDVFLLASDGAVGAPSIAAGGSADTRSWTAVYVDTPETLAPKLSLANERGLAGAGFWAIGYEAGLPGYTKLMERFRAGDALQ
jgi:spore germination protein YaaH